MDQPSRCSAPLSTLPPPPTPGPAPQDEAILFMTSVPQSIQLWPRGHATPARISPRSRTRVPGCSFFFFYFFPPVTRVSLFAGSIPLVPGSISLVPGCISLSLSLDGTEMLGLLRQMARSDLCLLANQPAPFPCLTFLSFFALSSSLSLFF